jgi:diguanylate cyclase (GGDEF)-like protein
MIDPLTGLLNRRAFLQDAQALLQQQIARGRPIGVLLVDLDHFKPINDCGRIEDQALHATASILFRMTRVRTH